MSEPIRVERDDQIVRRICREQVARVASEHSFLQREPRGLVDVLRVPVMRVEPVAAVLRGPDQEACVVAVDLREHRHDRSDFFVAERDVSRLGVIYPQRQLRVPAADFRSQRRERLSQTEGFRAHGSHPFCELCAAADELRDESVKTVGEGIPQAVVLLSVRWARPASNVLARIELVQEANDDLR